MELNRTMRGGGGGTITLHFKKNICSHILTDSESVIRMVNQKRKYTADGLKLYDITQTCVLHNNRQHTTSTARHVATPAFKMDNV
jgi:hypothetical protein